MADVMQHLDPNASQTASMASTTLSPLALERATEPGTQSTDDESILLSAIMAAHRKAHRRLTMPKWNLPGCAPHDPSTELQRGGDETVERISFHVPEIDLPFVEWSEATRVDTTKRDLEPEVGKDLLDLLSMPKDELCRPPSKVSKRKWAPQPCSSQPEDKRQYSFGDGNYPREGPTHSYLPDPDEVRKLHDPYTEQPWQPLPLFDHRTSLAHAAHLLEWEAKMGDHDLNQARLEPYSIHDEPCESASCKGRRIPCRTSEDICMGFARVEASDHLTKQFYQQLRKAHPSAVAKTQRPFDTQNADNGVDMHGVYRAFETPDAPIGVFSKAESDLWIDQQRLKLRKARIKNGETEAQLDAMETSLWGKSQAQLQSERAMNEDVLFAQHRLFPENRTHAVAQLYPVYVVPLLPSGDAACDAMANELEQLIGSAKLFFLSKHGNTAGSAAGTPPAYGTALDLTVSLPVKSPKRVKPAGKRKAATKVILARRLEAARASVFNLSDKSPADQITALDYATEVFVCWRDFCLAQMKRKKKTGSPAISHAESIRPPKPTSPSKPSTPLKPSTPSKPITPSTPSTPSKQINCSEPIDRSKPVSAGEDAERPSATKTRSGRACKPRTYYGDEVKASDNIKKSANRKDSMLHARRPGQNAGTATTANKEIPQQRSGIKLRLKVFCGGGKNNDKSTSLSVLGNSKAESGGRRKRSREESGQRDGITTLDANGGMQLRKRCRV